MLRRPAFWMMVHSSQRLYRPFEDIAYPKMICLRYLYIKYEQYIWMIDDATAGTAKPTDMWYETELPHSTSPGCLPSFSGVLDQELFCID
jgi:hypothetical protein